MWKALIIVFVLICVGCKKDPTSPDGQNSAPLVEEPDYVITASDFNFPVGKTWVYYINSSTTMANFNNPNDTNTNYTNTFKDTYTVTVISDSTDGALKYKYYSYRLSNGQSGNIQTTYTDTLNQNYHWIVDGTIGATNFGPNALSIKLPLTDTSRWNNLYYPSLSDINECQSLGFENLSSPYYLKCIKWERKYYPGNEYTNTYWFHKKHGFIKHIGTSYSTASGGNIITINSATTSLQSVY